MKNYQAMTEIEMCDEFKHWLEDEEVKAIIAEVRRRMALAAVAAFMPACGDGTQVAVDQLCIERHHTIADSVGGPIEGGLLAECYETKKTPAENGGG